MTDKKILMLASAGISTNIVFNTLERSIGIAVVIVEQKESKKTIIKRRINKLGYSKVLGQLLFQAMVIPVLSKVSKKRIKRICLENNLDTSEIPAEKRKEIKSINDEETIGLINQINPSVIIVNGTRIISKKTLQKITCPVINMHAGITPAYRGVHGGYWALANNDPAHCGVTVHLVDAGIDTGSVLYQEVIKPRTADNFITYPYLQLAMGMPLLQKAIHDACNENLLPVLSKGPSALWYHPTLGQYIYYYFLLRVK